MAEKAARTPASPCDREQRREAKHGSSYPATREEPDRLQHAAAEHSPYLTYEQAAVYTNVERTTIYRAVKRGTLKASGPGSAVRFHVAELDRWMNSRSRK